MNLALNKALAEGYRSNSQIARVLTEGWVKSNSYCPNCSTMQLAEFESGRPVADYYCLSCGEEFELKSKKGKLTKTITDGAYATMIERIEADNNPNFFFLTYSPHFEVSNFLIIPKQFFTPSLIIRRKRLPETARRAGWVGCNIDFGKISETGKIYLIKEGSIMKPERVREQFRRTLFLREQSSESRGWILDVLSCVERIPKSGFSLEEVYAFENELKALHPDNNFIKPKIRQQLQILRDRGLIEFSGRGRYRKISHENL